MKKFSRKRGANEARLMHSQGDSYLYKRIINQIYLYEATHNIINSITAITNIITILGRFH